MEGGIHGVAPININMGDIMILDREVWKFLENT
jgi:hypothetical protein